MQRVDDVFAVAGPQLMRRLTYELLLSVLETNTEICHSIDEAVTELTSRRKVLRELLGGMGIALAAQGTHPFADYRRQEFVHTEHYQWVAAKCGEPARRNLSFGQHVHVGVDDREGAVYAVGELARWTGPLLALSVNSPVFDGRLTGLRSMRTRLFGALPRTGFPPAFRSYADLEEYVERMLAAGHITRPGDLWWTIRPQPPLGTVEVRVMDCQTDLWRTGALAALVQALVKEYMERFHRAVPASRLRFDYVDANHWSAARFGLDGPYMDPTTGDTRTMRDAAGELLDLARTHQDALGLKAHLGNVSRILRQGTGADWIEATFRTVGGDTARLQHAVMERTVNRQP